MTRENQADATSILSRDAKLEGDVQGTENLHVDGHLKGSVKLSGNLFVGRTGVVEADIEADNVVIQGAVTGTVTARRQLEIQPSGKLMGDCSARSIDIREGAAFEGRSNMIKSAPRPPHPPAKKI